VERCGKQFESRVEAAFKLLSQLDVRSLTQEIGSFINHSDCDCDDLVDLFNLLSAKD